MKHLHESTPTFEDWEGVHEAVAAAYFPHDLHPRAGGAPARSELEVVDLGRARLADIKFGATVAIETEHPGALAVNLQLAGSMESRVAGRTWTVGPGQAMLFPPDTPVRFPAWSTDCRMLGLRVEKATLAREAERVFATSRMRLPRRADLATPMGSAWLRLVRTTFEDARGCADLFNGRGVGDAVTSMLVTGLLMAVVPEDDRGSSPCGPRPVHRVVSALEADPARPWTAADMAEIAGVSVRRLQQAFHDHLGTSPMSHLRAVRLQHVREDLSQGRGETVSDVALSWGFTHLGRFSADYRRRFGELPSRTLSRRP